MNYLNHNFKLAIVIPVYNEVEVIEKVIHDFQSEIISKTPNATLIIVEDGSNDGTKEILSQLKTTMSFKLISSMERKGYTKAFKDALCFAINTDYDLVFFCDSDCQHDPNDVFKLLEHIDSNDIVCGYKYPRSDPLYRILMSKFYNSLLNYVFHAKLRDINAGFKLFRKNVIKNIIEDVTIFEHCVMTEFILRAYARGYKIKEVPVKHFSRENASRALPLKKLPLIIINILKNILQLRISLKKQSKCQKSY